VLAKQSERQYYDFFASPTPRSTGGWSRVDLLTDARRGDIMAWRSPTVEAHVDTGHVVILAETPTLDASGAFYVVRVYDSAAEAHFDDTANPTGNLRRQERPASAPDSSI
jgi:hypothetical protein